MSNENFKIKVSTDEVEIALEGDAQTVIQQFEKIRELGLGKLTPRYSKPHQSENHSHITADHESLNNVVRKGLPGTEMEWVLVYAFYASKFGAEKFCREDILSKYKETERLILSRTSNLSNNINTAIKHKWITKLTATHFRMTDDGIRMVINILDEKKTAKPLRPRRKKEKKHEGKPEPTIMA